MRKIIKIIILAITALAYLALFFIAGIAFEVWLAWR